MDFSQFLESINQNISEALFRSSENGLVYANKAYAEMFGFVDQEEAIKTPSVLVYKNPEDRKELVKRLIRDGHWENQEVRFVRRDGSEFIGLVSTKLYEEENGEIFWDGTIRDITEQREIINKLLDREQLLNSINKNINEAIYRSINQEGLIYVNDEFVRMFGYDSAEDVLQYDVNKLYKDPDERGIIGDEIVANDSITNREVEFKRKDGSTFWGYLNSIQVKGLDGKIYFDGAIRDITMEKKAEEALKKQAEMQRLLINISSSSINLPIDEVDSSIQRHIAELGSFVEADRVYIFECDEGGDDCFCTFSWNQEGITPTRPDAEQVPVAGHLKYLLKSDSVNDHIYIPSVEEMEESDQKKEYQEMNIKTLLAVPLMSENKCIGLAGFDWVKNHHVVSDVEILLLRLFAEMLVNIRVRTSSEKELRKLFNKTIEQNQRLKDFSYITSHNFRSSVANLLGLITIIEDDRGNDEFFEMLKDTALKLNLAIDSINDLLNFEKDIASLEKADCNLFEIISDVIILNKKTAREKGISFDVNVPKDLTIKALPAYLQSILHNLITNAMKYGVTSAQRNIYISAEKTKEVVLLSVADDGVGIDLERYGEKLFQLGSRFHAGMDSGHGMGLYITKQQIEAIGGRVEVESEINKGTKFKVYLNA